MEYLETQNSASQIKRILHYIEEHGSITTFEATHYLNVLSPRKRLSQISEKTPLKKTPVVHISKDEKGNRKVIRYVRYSFADTL